MIRSKIKGVGMYVPEKVITNADLTQWMDTSDEWIQQRTGIQQRHWAESHETNRSFAKKAAEEALEQAKLKKEEIDLIVFCTLSPDHDFPGTGCFLQRDMGLSEIPALDIRQQCSGFLYGLAVADNFIRMGQYKNVLLVGSELHSKGLDISTQGRDVTVLFGDGAGAAVISAVEIKDPSQESCILSTHLHADGKFAEELWLPAPGMGFNGPRYTPELVEEGAIYPKMNGKTVFVNAVKRMPQVLTEALESNGLNKEDIDLYLFHQANARINEKIAQMMGLPEEKVFNTIHKYGNTTAATIPIGMKEAERAGKLNSGDLVGCAVFGSGFTWASAIIRW